MATKHDKRFWYFVLGALIIGIWLYALAPVVKAAPPTSLPERFSDIEWSFNGVRGAFGWVQSDGEPYCTSGTLADLANVLVGLPQRNEGESLSDYGLREGHNIWVRDLGGEDGIACAPILSLMSPSWVVEQFNTNADRPVKRIVDIDGVPTVNRSDSIGRIAHGQPCAEEIFSGTSAMWRRVTITYPDGSTIEGASVCRKQ